MVHTRLKTITIFIWTAVAFSACATVPKETVTLSTLVGQDIQQLQIGYRETIRFSFDQMRQVGLNVIENVWTPAYLNSFVEEGGLVEAAREGETERIQYWAQLAVSSIDDERNRFLEPLQQREDELIANIDAAFGRVLNSNAAVTANLNSVLKVQRLQDQIVEALGLSDIRSTINESIVSASEWAALATDAIDEAAKELEASN